MSPRRAKEALQSLQRPRVEGEREQEILDATIDVLAEVGYDRLTMDAVATRAKASKATLYRRWNDKANLVIDAIVAMKPPGSEEPPHTGTLRGDLLEMFCGQGHLTDQRQLGLLGSVLTAIGRDAEFAAAFRERFIAPKATMARAIWAEAAERGELREDIDLEIVATALPAIILHRLFMLGDQPTEELIVRVVDQIIIPAATRG